MSKYKQHFSYGFFLPFILKKKWIWFSDPCDVKNSAMVNFFSYNNVNKEGFHKKQGLTSIIDLNQNLDNIWEKIRKKFTRALISKGEKQGIVIKQDNNFKEFKKIYKSFRSKKKLSTDRFSLLKQGILFSAYYKDEMIAGHIFVADDRHMRSWVTASSRLSQSIGKDKRFISWANRMLIWEAIKYAKKNNLQVFDMGGLDLEDEGSPLTEFKESFGGVRKDCYYYHKIYSPLLKFWIKIR